MEENVGSDPKDNRKNGVLRRCGASGHGQMMWSPIWNGLRHEWSCRERCRYKDSAGIRHVRGHPLQCSRCGGLVFTTVGRVVLRTNRLREGQFEAGLCTVGDDPDNCGESQGEEPFRSHVRFWGLTGAQVNGL
jgi:hypothetical protein